MAIHTPYMHRCLQLAANGIGRTAPNPMVGAVMVYDNRIIGEGYHQLYGEAHAEVNCINSVKGEDLHLIEHATLYVSLEPCAHFGKTPPCADLIIEKKIPKVVVGCRDPFVQVNGKGIEKLQASGIEVVTGIMEAECMEMNSRFFTFHNEHRPFITLKWAQTLDGKIANNDHSRILISNDHTNRMVHKWRSEEMAILIGTNTALYDNPELTTRLWPGPDPVRLVVDLHLRLPKNLKLFNSVTPTIVFNLNKHTLPFEKVSITDLRTIGLGFYQVTEGVDLIHQIMNALYQLNIQSVLVEGGAQLLQAFIDEGTWDKTRIIVNEKLTIGNGLPAPVLQNAQLVTKQNYISDSVQTFKKQIR